VLGDEAAGKAFHGKALFQGEEIVLHGPFAANRIAAPLVTVLVFNDAAHGHVRHGEGLSRKFYVACLDHSFFKRLAGKFHDRAIRMNGARLKIGKMIEGIKWDFDVGVFPALIVQDFDAMVEKLEPAVVVMIVGIIKLDGGRARNPFDCQVRGRDVKPIPALSKAAPGQQEKTTQQNIAMAFDH
jgi:hypothetical protein